MSEKSGKRLVPKTQYFAETFERTAAYLCAAIFGCAGLFCLGKACIAILAGALNLNHEFGPMVYLIFGGFLGGVGCIGLSIARSLFNKAQEIGPVAPITNQNTADLPAVETFVRASELPPTQQQSELLRAAKYGQETPPEEMLRAGVTRGPE